MLGLNAAVVSTGKSFIFDGTVNAKIELPSAVLTVTPLTIVGWFKTSSANLAHTIGSIGGTTARFNLGDPNTVSDVMAADSVNSGGTTRSAAAASGYTVGTWQHFAAVFASTTSRTCYQDGVAGTTDTVSNTPSGMTKTTIGGRYSGGSYGQRATGLIAHVAVYNIALSGADIASLATPGTLPSSVQAGNLVFYVALTGGVAVDSISSTSLTISSGAVSSTDGPF